MNQNYQIVPIETITPYERNPRKISKEAIDAVAESIKQFGFQSPIIIDKDNVVIAGHTRLLAAKKLGLTDVPVIQASELTPEQAKALRLVDNKTSELTKWDDIKLAFELEDISFDMTLFGFLSQNKEDVYTQKIDGLLYEPTGCIPSFQEMSDDNKYQLLVSDIQNADLTTEQKNFLMIAATRHIVFDYKNIAEYYANTSPEMQRLMEDSALVIIDYDRALQNGFIKLSNTLECEKGKEIEQNG